GWTSRFVRNLIGNAEWGGVKLSDLFSDVGGVSEGAEYVVFYSVDGYSVGIPIAKAMMPDSVLAYAMNSVALPQNHGYPLRAVIPGLYGMMSAKWIRKIQVVNAGYVGYWQTRGWSDTGTVQTLAFITVPSDGALQSLPLTTAW
ncbi:MAG: molybdopterin-dependent oxidoreductase, partial [Nitrososphaerales archaeon]